MMMSALALMLAGGVAQASDAAAAQAVAFSCASGETMKVAIRSEGASAEVQYGEKDAVRVIARPSKQGARFSDSRHELRIVGNEASWKIGGRSAVKCTTEDAAQLAGLKR
jgi:uncharacterized membrane protein